MGHAVRLAAEEARAKIAALRRELASLRVVMRRSPSFSRRNTVCKLATLLAPALTSLITCRRMPTASPERNSVLDGGWQRRRDRSRHRDRPCAGDASYQRRRCRKADQSEDRRDAIVWSLADAARVYMFEKMHIDGGQVTNASLADCRFRNARRAAGDENEAVDAYQENGPFGAKGVGELATSAFRPRSQMLSRMPSAFVSRSCH